MSRRLDDALLATGPLAAALAAAVHPFAGVAVALALVATLVACARHRRARRARRAPVVVVAPLAPRRALPRPEVSVGAIAGSPAGVRALNADELGRARVRRTASAQHSLDAELVAACWSVATRRNARLTDAAAVELGLADAPLPRIVAPADPDPLLLAAVAA